MSRLHHRAALALSLLATATISPLAQAELFPRWEAGAGATVLNFPYYRGSDQAKTYLFPVPYFIYRGKFVQVDRQKVRGLFLRNEYGELDVSINGSPPVRSKDIRAREDMPDLDAAFEIGPSVNLFLYRSQDHKRGIDLRLPLRSVTVTDFHHLQNAGWLAQPQLVLDLQDQLGGRGWNFGLAAGLLFADQRYHHYFYGVDSAFARPDRPAYEAHGGYSGGQLVGSLTKRYDRWWVGGFMKYDNLTGAAFADSPLVRTRQAYSGGLAVVWVFSQSEERVEALP